MTNSAPQKDKQSRTFLRMLPGIIITLATIAFLLWKIDLSQTYQALLKVEFWRLGVAVVLLVLAFTSRAMAWRTSLQGQVSLNKAFSTEVIGYLLNTILPFRLGEVGRAVAMANNTPLTFWEVFPTLVIERVFDLGILAGLLFGTLPFLVGAQWAASAAVFAGVLVGLGFIVMYGMVLKPDWVLSIFKWLTGKWPRLQQFGQEKVELFLRGLSVLRNPSRFLLVLFWMLVTWGLTLAWNTTVLYSFYPQPTLLEAGVVVAFASMGVAAPSTQGNLGVYEAALVSAFLAMGAGSADGLAFALATHALYLLVTFVLGFYGLSREKISLKDIYRQAQNRPQAEN